MDVEAGRRGASGRPDARGDGLCPLWRGSRRCRIGVGASAAPCWFVFRHWRLCRAVHTPPKPMVTSTLTRQHAGPSPEPPIGRSHGTATLEPPTAFAAGRRLLATWTRTMMSEAPDCLCRREAAFRRTTATSACRTFARAACWALARDRYAGAPDCLCRREAAFCHVDADADDDVRSARLPLPHGDAQ